MVFFCPDTKHHFLMFKLGLLHFTRRMCMNVIYAVIFTFAVSIVEHSTQRLALHKQQSIGIQTKYLIIVVEQYSRKIGGNQVIRISKSWILLELVALGLFF